MPHMPRLYTNADLVIDEDDEDIILTKSQAHYLRNVLRREVGDMIHLFNEEDGEWVCVISDFSKNSGTVTLGHKLKSATPLTDLWVLCAPIKKLRFDFCLEKTVELGASDFIPVYTDYTDIRRANVDRLSANAIEAAQQCGATSIVTVHEPLSLDVLLDQWDDSRVLYVCTERGHALAFTQALKKQNKEKAAILIGPEGGFSDAELERLKTHSSAVFIHLGDLILRTETALTAAVTLYQSMKGAWSKYER